MALLQWYDHLNLQSWNNQFTFLNIQFVDIVHLPNLKDYDLSSLTTILMGGAPCPLELAKMATAKLGLKHTLVIKYLNSIFNKFSSLSNGLCC